MELTCAVQEYAWGKLGQKSQVAKFAPAACKDFMLDESKPYAELWMGVHPNGPSVIAETGETLAEYISKNPDCLGSKVSEKFQGQLPFLFKVLSVNKALSIQAHPAKEHAESLHATRPDVYKDPNHKPEIAIALTEFEGLCGFRPLEEIQGFLSKLPELQNCLGDKACKELLSSTPDCYEVALKAGFKALMQSESSVLKVQLDALAVRIQNTEGDLLEDLYLRLIKEFPGDVGCFVIYFLNRVKLQPGQAMYLGPNVPHAYLSGDCIECMANSDNVVRAGLTPKLIDTSTLVNMLEYRCGPAEDRKFAGQDSGSSVLFNPPVPDFSVNRIQVLIFRIFSSHDDYVCVRLETPGLGGIVMARPCQARELRDNPYLLHLISIGWRSILDPKIDPLPTHTTPSPYMFIIPLFQGSVLFLPCNKILELFPEDCEELVAYQAFSSD
ncbi:mannose-6-phosphate isomerase [Eurytemora carolleeae]|uniref:mannose-6-phosphate isomerase n=1 Tax=Eurytemora carolleeae TaxID=1294199 RepID=UPI000C77F50B|nr:mannose-6-phosphate isomerase [Eurytemora carolleeae]|eukprot:XP_023326981.1 mannose-6-phosphate isomerase-like [Eurytemora affinis]